MSPSPSLPQTPPVPSSPPTTPSPPSLTPLQLLLLSLAASLLGLILLLLCALFIPNFVPPTFIRASLHRFPSLHHFLRRFPILRRIPNLRHFLFQNAEPEVTLHAMERGEGGRGGARREAGPWSPLSPNVSVSPDVAVPAALAGGDLGERSPPPRYEVGDGEGRFVVGEDEDGAEGGGEADVGVTSRRGQDV